MTPLPTMAPTTPIYVTRYLLREIHCTVVKMRIYFVISGYTAIDSKLQVGEVLHELVDEVILQWRDLAIIIRREVLIQNSLPRMDDEVFNLSFGMHMLNEMSEVFIRVDIIHSNATFYSGSLTRGLTYTEA